VLSEAVLKPDHAARIGGDEFAILMPAADEREGDVMIANINRLIDINNQFYTGLTLGLSMGAATSRPGERLEAVVKRADLRMFQSKREFYSALEDDRRQAGAGA
jgi:diguanylate cyclase (GGDEF)-like protein